ncbi:MAG TPA: hypothetical protein VGN59_09490 [Acidimicrobiia bacterium]
MRTDDEVQPTPRDRGWTIGFAALLVLPLVVSAVYLWFAVGTAYHPNSDWALFELHTRDVFHHLLFVGPYSRYGWNHPGPLLFYTLALPYKLSGSRSISLHITALIVNGLTIVAIAWVAFRRGRLPMVIAVLLPLGLLTHALGADVLRNPWNPYLPVLPLLLLLLLCWSVAVGDLWMLPFAAAVASFVIQLHVGLLLVSAVFLLVALAAIVVRGFRATGDDRRSWWRRVLKAVAVSAGVLFVLWLPVLYGTFVRRDGNIGNIIQFFQGDHDTLGFTRAFQVLGLQWGIRPEWIFGPRGNSVVGVQSVDHHWWLALALALGIVAVVVAARRGSVATLWLAGIVGAGFVAAAVAVSNIVDADFPYLTRWTWVLGVGLGILVLRAGWLAVGPERRAVTLRWAVPVAGVLLVVLSVTETVDALDAGTPFPRLQSSEETITRQVLAHLPPGKGTVLIDNGHATLQTPGIVLALEKHGIPTAVVPSQVVMFGYDRDVSHGPYRAGLVTIAGGAVGRVKAPEAGTQIARYTRPLNAGDRRGIHAYIRQTEGLPASKDRTALLKELHHRLTLPAQIIEVYLVPPKVLLRRNRASHTGQNFVRPFRS